MDRIFFGGNRKGDFLADFFYRDSSNFIAARASIFMGRAGIGVEANAEIGDPSGPSCGHGFS
jgi:hypothetical protein